MILKGTTVKNVQHARHLARHYLKDENEQIEVWNSTMNNELGQIEPELVDMQLMTELTHGTTGIFQVAISPRPGEEMDRVRWERSITAIAQGFQLEEQPYITIFHRKDGREHIHVCWSLVNEEEKIIQLGLYKRKLQSLAQNLEHEFGHEPIQRTATDRTFEVTNADRMRKARTGQDPLSRKQFITEMYMAAQSAQDFKYRLEVHGYRLGHGERCRFAIIDRNGEIYNLVKQLPKTIKTKDVAMRLQGLELRIIRKDQVKTRPIRKRRVDQQIKCIERKRKEKALLKDLQKVFGNDLKSRSRSSPYFIRDGQGQTQPISPSTQRMIDWMNMQGYRLNQKGKQRLQLESDNELYLLIRRFEHIDQEKEAEKKKRHVFSLGDRFELSNTGQSDREQQVDNQIDRIQQKDQDNGRDL